MKAISKEELRKIQINILNEIDTFCKKNDIKYWLHAGTLLGAIRHQGYIPWDDDIDIAMFREDYDKFCSLYNKSNNQYKLHCYENDKKHFYPFAKVYDSKTIWYEPDSTGDKISVFVDVFPLDNAPENNKNVRRMLKKRDFYYMCNFHYREKTSPKGNFIKKIAVIIFRKLIKTRPRSFYIKKLIENSKKYQCEEAKKIGDFTGMGSFILKKDLFDELIDKKFENGIYPVPKRYDEFLTAIYGNYMQLPPEDKRIAHTFDAYYVEK